jgi:hypothetical protein
VIRPLVLTLCALLLCHSACAATYQVGPARQYKTLQQVSGLLKPGDSVEVDGGHTYPGGVTLSASGLPGEGRISIIGKEGADGKCPIISGVTAPGGTVFRVFGSHYLIQNLDITVGGDLRAARCFYNVGDDITLADSAVHDSPCTGIAGADASGSLTLDDVEVYHCGTGLFAHQIYVGSGIKEHPEAVFRMWHCWVHDATGGNDVKSRVTRNIIASNWIEGPLFHVLDLVGPDPKDQKGIPPDLHCDSDVIGNVLVLNGANGGTLARLGSDGTGDSRGIYRFAYNTVIVPAKASAGFGLFWIKGQVASVELWDNVFWSPLWPLKMTRIEQGAAPVLRGGGNWAPNTTIGIPPAWNVARGVTPGFAHPAAKDYHPVPTSPLVGRGVIPTEPDLIPRSSARDAQSNGGFEPRSSESAKDIGAFAVQAGTQ